MTLTDKCPMPYGKHKGKKMANVPASYLLYLDENKMASDAVQAYINENREFLEAEDMEESDYGFEPFE